MNPFQERTPFDLILLSLGSLVRQEKPNQMEILPEANNLKVDSQVSNFSEIVISKNQDVSSQPEQSQEEEKVDHLLNSQVPVLVKTEASLKRGCIDELVHEELKHLRLNVESSQERKDPIFISLKPQRTYQVATKLKAIELAKKVGVLRVSANTGIPESSIRRWSKVGPSRLGCSGRRPAYPQIERALLKLFKECRQKGIQVTNAYLIKEARKVAELLEVPDFLGSNGWLSGFKRRNKIVNRRKTRIASKLKPDSVENFKKFQERIIELTQKHQYQLDAIVNMDETGVTFDSPSNYTLEMQVKYFIKLFLILKGKKEVLITTTSADKQRITTVIAVNASNDFLPVYAIIKGKKVPLELQIAK